MSLINFVTAKLTGDIKIVNAYYDNISPCVDCRYCWKNSGCAIDDEMQAIYKYLEDCDNILIASPIYFSELTGKLLDVASRLQTYFCAHFFRGETPTIKSKKGAIILVGGGDGSSDKAHSTARTILHQMNCRNIHDLAISHNTNKCPAIEDKKIIESLNSIAEFFNE